MNKFIYVASPYSTNADEKLMQYRAKDTALLVGKLMNRYKNCFFYSPVIYFRQIALECDLPHTREFWWGVNKYMLDKTDELCVLQMTGWEESDGVKQEIDYAISINLPIAYEKVSVYADHVF
jgi:hypothetical protein